MKLTFDDAIERINDGLIIKDSDIQAKALSRFVWVAEWHIPGCLSESFSICTSKADAIDTALTFADSPRGMKTALQKHGRFDSDSPIYGLCVNTISKQRLIDLL